MCTGSRVLSTNCAEESSTRHRFVRPNVQFRLQLNETSGCSLLLNQAKGILTTWKSAARSVSAQVSSRKEVLGAENNACTTPYLPNVRGILGKVPTVCIAQGLRFAAPRQAEGFIPYCDGNLKAKEIDASKHPDY